VGDPRDPGRRRRPALIARLRGRAATTGAPRASFGKRLRRALRPPRKLRPTRAGWLFFGLVFAIGFAALNTGNNLLYLVLSLLLAFLVLSGVLSEAALRGIRVERRLPFEWIAGRGARVVLEIANAQRKTWAHAIVVEDLGAAPGDPAVRALGRAFALRVEPGATESRSYRFEPTSAASERSARGSASSRPRTGGVPPLGRRGAFTSTSTAITSRPRAASPLARRG